MEWWWAWSLTMVTMEIVFLSPSLGGNVEFSSTSVINNVVSDPRTGRLYVGAVNSLYQLNSKLEVEFVSKTGPRRDNQLCTPPVTNTCEEAKDTDNHNKLLLVHSARDILVVCGSVFRGICSLRNLSNVDHVIYFSDSNGEKSYVASTEEGVSVVGVMSYYTVGGVQLPVFLVGKGFGGHDCTKLIATRILQDYHEWVVFDSIIEASAVQAASFVRAYLHDFRFAFTDNKFVYFLFSRTLGTQDMRVFTVIARMCENDHSYYSYTELQLNCSATNKYNKAQAAFVGEPGQVLAKNLSSSNPNVKVSDQDKVLFVTFTSDEDPHSSAMCMYPLQAINDQFEQLTKACYLKHGMINDKSVVYSPYANKPDESCGYHPNSDNYKCGAEFLPSPLASKAEFALSAEPSVVHKTRLTAVAVAVEMGHAVGFLGTASGKVLKVHLSASSKGHEQELGEGTGDEVNKNLLFDSSREHLFITTREKISKVPVQACHLKTSCQDCVSMKDPYCGWCVLEGKCSQKKDCGRSTERNTWLWSPDQKCVEIQTFDPPNLSCKKTQQVVITIPALPALREQDQLECSFGSSDSFDTAAQLVQHSQTQVACSLPNPEVISSTPGDWDFVSVPLKIRVNKTTEVTSGEFHFYNCAATVKKNENTPCITCVTSQWGCQWDAQNHVCSDQDDSVSGLNIVKPQQPDNCPRFESPEPQLIPVGVAIPISFQGKNLDIYDGRSFSIGTELMTPDEEQVTKTGGLKFQFGGYRFSYDVQQEVNVSFHIKDTDNHKIDSTLTVVLYNCAVGREDCSLCKHADAKYSCVWCPARRSCVYRELCQTPEPQQCPDPQIVDIVPRFGPMNGRIAVTIRGSNMGIRKEDITSITVAGVECTHLADRYSVSTSVVCEIGPVSPAPPLDVPVDQETRGVVVVEVVGGRRGTSKVEFTYRDPKPTSVLPTKGPAAGGTVITIKGDHLNTATKEDVAVSVGNVPCEVLSFGEEITCKTGRYQGQKVPTEPLPVTVKYGRNTTKEVRRAFQYCENPKIVTYKPQSSFMCGGRRIVVEGNRFDLIQSAKMKVQMVVDEEPDAPPVEFVQPVLQKNDSILEFLSPEVNCCSSSQSLRTFIQLDNMEEELRNFDYHTNPTFDKLYKDKITETGIIIVNGRGFLRAMTMEEAKAFIEDVPCQIKGLQDDTLMLEAPSSQPKSKNQLRNFTNDMLELKVKFGGCTRMVGHVYYNRGDKEHIPLAIIIPAVIVPMLLFIVVSVYCYRRKSQQAEREYEKVKHQLESLEESVRDRCKKEFTDLMIEMEDHTSDLSEGGIPFLDYKIYTDRIFFWPSKDSSNDPVITGNIPVPEARKATVNQALTQFSNLLNSKTFLINFIRTLESRPDFNARARGYFASLLTVALHGKLEYYTDIMRTLLLELMDEHVQSKNPKLMLRRSETVVERMLCNWMSICLYQFLRDSAGEPLYKLFKALKHQVEKGPVDAKLKKAKYTLNDTGLLGDDVEYSVLTLQVFVHGEGPDVTPVKVLNCDTITQVKEKIIDQVYRNLTYSQRPKVDTVALEWRPGSTGQILSDLDLTSQKEGRWTRINTLAHYNIRDNATVVLSTVMHTQSFHQHQDNHDEKNALLEDDNTFHLVRPTEEIDEGKSKRGSMKDKAMTKAITEIYLTRLLSVKGTLQQFVDNFFRSVLCSSSVVPPAVKYFFDFLDEQALRHDNVDEETLHIWKTNSLPLRFWVNILRNPHFILDVHVTEVVDASLHVIAQTFMDACTKTEHKLSRESPSNKLLYAKEISSYKKMVDDYYSGIKQMIPVSDQDMNTHLAEVSREHTHKLHTQAALHQLYHYASKYYDVIIQSLDEDPAAQNKQLTLRLQQVAAALENKVTDL
ncbi:plexin-B2 [Oryzias melastigma]|uniref:plexin-B2 n=1 Tax=Oryzias melastigma TaxID=30732 RepID=UPI000CF7EF87|nr:plexin-B2 [Oryzias melastigma]XP_024140557.1 plexin-B2 [Oryzias melastigma]XP_036066153.1 plexin-B2 [Oryzias melastigma]